MDEFNKIILDLENINIKNDDEDQVMLLLCSLPGYYENPRDNMIYGSESLMMEEVHWQSALMSKELSKRSDVISEGQSEGQRSYRKKRI